MTAKVAPVPLPQPPVKCNAAFPNGNPAETSASIVTIRAISPAKGLLFTVAGLETKNATLRIDTKGVKYGEKTADARSSKLIGFWKGFAFFRWMKFAFEVRLLSRPEGILSLMVNKG